MKQNERTRIQEQIGYEFKNDDLLQQAFVRRSYAKENGGEDNEVLEFIGDKALDFIVVKLLTEKYGYYLSETEDYQPSEDCNEFASNCSEGELTNLKKKLVEKSTLSNCIDNLGLADYLIMGQGDIKNNVQESQSVKEDLFEAIVGAIALDSNWDVKSLEDSIEIMLNPDEILETEDVNYIAEIQDWSLRNSGALPMHRFDKTSMQSTWYWPKHPLCIYAKAEQDTQYACELQFPDVKFHFVGYGPSKSKARKCACKMAYEYLDKEGMLFTIADEIDEPSREMAINQLEILARRGYFSVPEYHFNEEHDSNGNPIWTCECHIIEKDYYYDAKSQSKKNAKKDAAYQMLCAVLSEEE